jgi:DNA-binding response OmpR family regulator
MDKAHVENGNCNSRIWFAFLGDLRDTAMPILIADDDHDTVVSQALLFRKRGYEVIECEHGRDVMPLVEERRPCVLLLDLSMPGMDGFDVAQELKENPDLRPHLLIAVTGHGDEATRRRVEEAGFDYHFLKPVNFGDLLALVHEVDRKPQQVQR